MRIFDRLATREGESLPHVYSDGTLCLHLSGEWNEKMYLVDSIVPWTAEWLANYEIWLATGDWNGGGEWPLGRSPPDELPAADVNDPSTARLYRRFVNDLVASFECIFQARQLLMFVAG